MKMNNDGFIFGNKYSMENIINNLKSYDNNTINDTYHSNAIKEMCLIRDGVRQTNLNTDNIIQLLTDLCIN